MAKPTARKAARPLAGRAAAVEPTPDAAPTTSADETPVDTSPAPAPVSVRDVMWVEKYRPTSLEEMALPGETRALLQSYIDAGEIPHLLLPGPAGTGKTSVSKILYGALDCRVLVLNASKDRGIDKIREQVTMFVRSRLLAKLNVVHFDEADGLTRDAQEALRNLLETYASVSRFIFTCNRLSRIIDPIQSRCQIIEFAPPPLQDRAKRLQHVLKAEGVPFEKMDVIKYAETFRDMRRMLNAAQQSFLTHGKLVPVSALAVSGDDLLAAVMRKDWAALRAATADANFDAEQALRVLFWAVPDDHANVARWRAELAKGLHESTYTPDPVVLFLGVCSELIDTLSR